MQCMDEAYQQDILEKPEFFDRQKTHGRRILRGTNESGGRGRRAHHSPSCNEFESTEGGQYECRVRGDKADPTLHMEVHSFPTVLTEPYIV